MVGDLKSLRMRGVGRSPVPTEDFLYHLHRGSDLLMQDRVVEAKEALEQALTHQPQDAKSQDLLAGVYFRLGVYPRAIEIWSHLLEAHPQDVTLRVNLGLALFKTGQHEEALEHIHAALRIQPDHERAWGYLGLIQWRRGQPEEARDAFLRGGQATMARRMEEALGRGGVPDATEEHGSTPADETDASRGGVRSAAGEAVERMEAGELPMVVADAPVEEDAASGTWETRAPGEEPVPVVHERVRTLPTTSLPGLSSLLTRWLAVVSDGDEFAIDASGHLLVRTEDSVVCRLDGLTATQGTFRTAMVRRRSHGQELDEILGGDSPMMRWHGPVGGVLVPPEGHHFVAFRLDEGDVVSFREDVLFAFDDGVGWETGRLPSAHAPPILVHLTGPGEVVLCLGTSPTAVRVEEGQETRVDPARLVGWTGRLLPGAARGTLPYAATAPPLSFRGEGLVLLR